MQKKWKEWFSDHQIHDKEYMHAFPAFALTYFGQVKYYVWQFLKIINYLPGMVSYFFLKIMLVPASQSIFTNKALLTVAEGNMIFVRPDRRLTDLI